MSLYKRGNVYWSAIWIDGVRQMRSLETSNRRQAETLEQRWRDELHTQRFQLPNLKPEMPFAELWARFLAEGDVKAYHKDRAKMLLPFFGEMPIRPDFKQTDIFGALALASQFFVENTGANRKELVIFSDMRESIPGMDFERMSAVPRYERTINKQAGLPDLSGVHVNVAGVDGAGKSTAYWAALRRFWEIYFQNARANLEVFTVLAEMRPDP